MVRVAKFGLKVGSRRTTKIRNLVVLAILLVALISLLYHILFVISCQTDICIEIAKNEEIVKTIFSDPPKNLVVRRTTTSHFLVVITHFLVVEDTRTREFCYPDGFRYLKTGFRPSVFNVTSNAGPDCRPWV